MTPIERLLVRIEVEPGGCWIYPGGGSVDGYGSICVDGRMLRAHRFSYEHFVGPIPEGLVIDHLCRTRRCVNPVHLEAVTQGENVARGEKANAKKTHCPQGHPLDRPEIAKATGRPIRRCSTCVRERSTRQTAKRRAARGLSPQAVDADPLASALDRGEPQRDRLLRP